MVKTFIFDIGGVLVYTDYDRVCGPLAALSNRNMSFVRHVVDNGPIVQLALKGAIDAQGLYETICKELRIDIEYTEFREIWTKLLRVNPGIIQIVEQLKLSYGLALASNTDQVHSGYCFEHFDVLKNFKTKFLSFEMGLIKPDPEYFRYVLKELGNTPEECVLVDDREENVESAKSIGISGVHFTDNESLRVDLLTICQ